MARWVVYDTKAQKVLYERDYKEICMTAAFGMYPGKETMVVKVKQLPDRIRKEWKRFKDGHRELAGGTGTCPFVR